jgi:hypothetical protein
MGLDKTTAEVTFAKYKDLIAAKGGFTFGVFKELVVDISLQFRKQEGRFYSLLSLDEGEHFRGLLHAKAGKPILNKDGQPVSAALWTMGDHGATLLGNSSGYCPANNNYQHSSMTSAYRFLNSDTYFDNTSLIVLLRILEMDPCELREKFWTLVRACRRRRQIVVDGSMPIMTVFNTKDEYEFMEYRAIVKRVQIGLSDRGMLIFDAFRAFNSSNSGLLTCSELYGGLEFLNITFTPQQIYDLVRRISVQTEVKKKSASFFCRLMS